MLTTCAKPAKTLNPVAKTARQTLTTSQPRPSFLATLLRTLSVFAA
jgi:hypothetical protein